MDAPTVDELVSYINDGTTGFGVHTALPATPPTSLLQLCLDAALGVVEADCSLPTDSYPPEVKLAVLRMAARLWAGRNTPYGIVAVDETTALRVPSNDPDYTWLMAHYRRFPVGRGNR